MADNSLGTLLFSANHETGNISQWSSGGNGGNFLMNPQNIVINNVTTERAHTGTYSIKTQLNAGQNQMAATQYFRFGTGGEPWNNPDAIYTCWYYIPSGIDFIGVSWHQLMEFKGKYTNGLSYPIFTMGLDVRGGKGSGGANYLNLRYVREHFPLGGGSYNINEILQRNLPIGQWFKIQTRYIQSTTNQGRIIVWLDDERIYDVSGVMTKPPTNNGGSAITEMFWGCNNYGQGFVPSILTVFLDDATIHLPGTGGGEEPLPPDPETEPEPEPSKAPVKVMFNGVFEEVVTKIKVDGVLITVNENI